MPDVDKRPPVKPVTPPPVIEEAPKPKPPEPRTDYNERSTKSE